MDNLSTRLLYNLDCNNLLLSIPFFFFFFFFPSLSLSYILCVRRLAGRKQGFWGAGEYRYISFDCFTDSLFCRCFRSSFACFRSSYPRNVRLMNAMSRIWVTGEREREEREIEREIEKERESDLDERCGNCEREDERGRQIDRKIGYFPRDGVFRSEKKAREGGREVRRGGSPTGVKIASHVPGDSVDLIWFPHRAQHLGSSLVHSALKLASLDPEMLHSFFLSIYCPRPSTERRIEEESRFY